jgi:predicted phage terminase large subunit-like protein
LPAPPAEILRLALAEKARRDAERRREALARDADAIRGRCSSLAGFVRSAWHVLEPSQPYVHGWHISAICRHLEAITRGDLLARGAANRLLINVPPGSMKALDSDTPVLTLDGWRRHGDLEPGDFVYGPDGQPKRVLAATPEVVEESFAVRFDDGAEIVAGSGHEWLVDREEVSAATGWRRRREPMIVTTPDLQAQEATRGTYARPDRIGVAAAFWSPRRSYIIDPYLLGAWLGDGATDSGCIYSADQDVEHFSRLGAITATAPASETRRQAFHRILVEGLQVRLRVLGLLGNKHVPADYLAGSYDQRLALLQGLMDTDGHAAGACRFTNKNETLVEAVAFLAVSIGAKAYRSSRFTVLNGQRYGPHFAVEFTPPPGVAVFRLERKQANVRQSATARTFARYVHSVTQVGPRVVKCIQVEGGLYLAGRELVPTHNSLLVSVFWPAWEWGPCGRPETRYLATSYSEAYVKRDSRRMRDLVSSEWFRSLWPSVQLVRAGEASFANDRTGFREGVPFASLTGGRGDRVIIDDPHSTETAESPAERARTTRIFRESVPSRVNDPERSAIIVIMQRLHEDDVSGQILKLGLGYQHLMLPMRFEPERRARTVLGFVDPREDEGELLFPERFPPEVLERDQKALTAYAVAGQYQQRPVPREGGMFQRSWFDGRFIGAAPDGTKWVRHWDLAATKKIDAARTAGVKLGRTPAGRYVVGHVVTTQDEGHRVRSLIKATAQADGPAVEISLPQDPGQAGKVQAQDLIALLAGFVARAEPETGDKATRAMPFSAQCEAGNVDLVRGVWNEAYIDELCMFPGGSHKDQVDASSGAFARLAVAADPPRASIGTRG